MRFIPILLLCNSYTLAQQIIVPGTGSGGSVDSVTASAPLASSGGATPNISVNSAQGNGNKIQLSTGTTTTNDCVKYDANGNTVDAGAACGSGGGGGSVGANGAVQTSNGSGGFSDSGCTASSGAMTCSGGFTSSGPGAISLSALTVSTGTAASRGTCSVNNTAYLATDTHAFTTCNGTSWSATLNPTGSYVWFNNAGTTQLSCYTDTGVSCNSGGSSLKGVIVYTTGSWTPSTSAFTSYSPTTIDYDSSGGTMWSSGTPTVITAPSTGTYKAECVITGGSGSGYQAIQFLVNGTTVYSVSSASVSTDSIVEGSRTIRLNASDTVACQYYLGNSGSTAGGNNNSHFVLVQAGW